MELKEFIKTVLVEVSQGVGEAQKEVTGNTIVNPSFIKDGYINHSSGKREITNISFKIGVSINDSTAGKSALGVITGLFQAGVGTENKQSNTSITNIEFSVPIALPTNDKLTKKGISISSI